jgi:hypothetical protein
MSCSLSGAVNRLGHKYRVLLKEIFRAEGVPTQGRIISGETFVLELLKAQLLKPEGV